MSYFLKFIYVLLNLFMTCWIFGKISWLNKLFENKVDLIKKLMNVLVIALLWFTTYLVVFDKPDRIDKAKDSIEVIEKRLNDLEEKFKQLSN